MRKLSTGEPYAGKLHVRFGGRGGPAPFSTPIAKRRLIATDLAEGAALFRPTFSVLRVGAGHSALIFAALITLIHFA